MQFMQCEEQFHRLETNEMGCLFLSGAHYRRYTFAVEQQG